MAENKKSFILYCDQSGVFDKLPDAKAGKLIKLIFDYVNDKNPETEDVLLQVAFEPIKLQLKRDLKEWHESRSKRSEAGKMGGIKSGLSRRKRSKRSNASKNEANEAVNGTVTVNVTDTVSVKKERSFTAPSLDQVREYFAENGYGSAAADKAFSYYDEAGWVDSKGNKVRNWKQKMISVWFKDENKIKTKGRISQFDQNQW